MSVVNRNTKIYRCLLLVSSVLAYNTIVNAGFAEELVPPSHAIQTENANKSFSGNVSWYGPGFNGKPTASGEIFDMNKLTAAHRTLRLGLRVLVEDPKTGKSIIVKVNDRGPYARNHGVYTRVMDLSKGGGRKLEILSRGVAYVDCLVLN